nr:odorant binding protein [Semanotus bifasciatus]
MKSFALVICVIVLATLAYGGSLSTVVSRRRITNAHNQCQADPATHVDEEDLKKSLKGIQVSGLGPHMLCMSKKIGLQKSNGDIDRAVFRVRFSEIVRNQSKLDDIVEGCAVQKETPEDTAEHIMKCFHQHHPCP